MEKQHRGGRQVAASGLAHTLRRELWASAYYRSRPLAAAQLLYARWRLSRAQPSPADPTRFLDALGIPPDDALQGLGRWRTTLEEVVRLSERVDDAVGVAVSEGVVLYGLVRALRPEHVVETGVATGVSTSFIAAALVENGAGRLYSIDLPPRADTDRRHADGSSSPAQGPGWGIPAEIRSAIRGRHELILEDVRTALPSLLARLPRVDLFLHDDLHTPDHMLWEYRLVWPHLRTGGVLASDDINFGWIRFCRGLRMGRRGDLNLQRLGVLIKA
jgi:Methyltransferase domain